MMSRQIGRGRGGGKAVGTTPAEPSSPTEIVTHYRAVHGPVAAWERKAYQDLPSLREAIREAVLSHKTKDGLLHSHQRRIGNARLATVVEPLSRVEGQIAQAKDFAEIHSIVDRVAGAIKGIGDLAVYDFAHRIGAYRRTAPHLIYLHQGTRRGAHALGLTGRTCSVTDLPQPLQDLSPEEAEDCLCIYAGLLERFYGSKVSTTKGRSPSRAC